MFYSVILFLLEFSFITGGNSMETALQEIVYGVCQILNQQGIGKDAIKKYESTYRKLQYFYRQRGNPAFSPQVNKEFLDLANGRHGSKLLSNRQFNRLRRAVAMLENFLNSGSILVRYSYGSHIKHKVSEHYGKHIEQCCAAWNVSKGTKEGCRSVLREFFCFALAAGIEDVDLIDGDLFYRFIMNASENHEGSRSNMMYALRKLLAYLDVNTKANLPSSLASLKTAQSRRRVLPCFSKQELFAILKCPDLRTSLGKRDYAILLLATFTGLRGIDIVNLSLSDIDWTNDAMQVIQHKTGVMNHLPMTSAVSAAIADYILNARPDSDSPYVFLTAVKPFKKLNDIGSIYNIIAKYMRQSGIVKIPRDGKGFHAIRRCMGVWLLDAGTSLEMISQVLGHTDGDMAKRYLPMSFDHLRECALDFTDISIKEGVYR
jgi:integrase